MSTTSSRPEWSGDMLDRPEMTEAFATQLRQVLNAQAEYVSRIRRDAEAMWRANPPEGYGSFETWWRHRWVTTPFAAIQEHIETAAKLTFELEARFRKGRHEIPDRKLAAAELKKQAKQAPAIAPGRAPAAEPRSTGGGAGDGSGLPDFLQLVRQKDSA
jgi:hypothetical protein